MTTNQQMPSDPAIDELLGAFALDSVVGDERDRVASYLAVNELARREVDDLRETAAMLALAPFDHEPAPADLWNRIVGSIDVSSAASKAPDAVIDLDARREARNGRTRAFVSISAVAASLVLVLGVMSMNRDSDGGSKDFEALADAGTTLKLAGSAPARVALADGRGILDATEMPDLEPGTVYQAWAVYPDLPAPISIGVFDTATEFSEFRYGEGLNAIAITVEQNGGVVQSTNDPVAVGALS